MNASTNYALKQWMFAQLPKHLHNKSTLRRIRKRWNSVPRNRRDIHNITKSLG